MEQICGKCRAPLNSTAHVCKTVHVDYAVLSSAWQDVRVSLPVTAKYCLVYLGSHVDGYSVACYIKSKGWYTPFAYRVKPSAWLNQTLPSAPSFS